MNKVIKKVLILIFIFISLFSVLNCSYANFGINNLTGDLSELRQTESKVVSLTEYVLGLVLNIGSIASVVVLVIIGIKYMLGSIEERAEYKKTLMPYCIGCLIVFASSTIAGIIYQIITTNLLK